MTPEQSAAGEPTLTGQVLERPELEARLDEALGKRLTSVVAGAGYGKTTLLREWSQKVERAWHTATPADRRLGAFATNLARALDAHIEPLSLPDAATASAADEASRAAAIATHLAAQLEVSLQQDLVLIVDDAHLLTDSPSALLLEGLVRQSPPRLHLVLSSRRQLPFRIGRIHGRGELLEIVAGDLAFDAYEVSRLAEAALGGDDGALAAELYELTQGWPAAVRLALSALGPVEPELRRAALDRLHRPAGPLFEFLTQEVLEYQPPSVRELIRAMTPFDRFTIEMCESLGVSDCRATIGSLSRQGLFLSTGGDDPALVSLHTLVREFARARLPLADEEEQALHGGAAAWLEAHGALDDALEAHRRSGRQGELSRFLAERGEELLARGAIDAVVKAATALPADLRRERIDELLGEAYSLRGAWVEAQACFERAAAGRQELPAGIAWRMGRMHWDRGQIDFAAKAWERGRADGSRPADEALLLAWLASPYRSSGDLQRARELATRSLKLAELAQSDRALAAAHTAVGHMYLGHDNARFERHLDMALDAARAAGDVLHIVRGTIIRCGPAEPHDAILRLGPAITLAELAGADLYLARALNARGENYLALGRYAEAGTDLRRALSLMERLGSVRRNWALMSLANIARLQGDLAYARTAYAEALEISHDAEGMINAQSGLARTLAFEEPDEARRLADAALGRARELGYMLGLALLAAGWVALARGELDAAREFAREALSETHRQRLPYEYAEALELEAAVAGTAEQGRRFLGEALGAWRKVGNEVASSRVELALARLAGDRAAAERARRRLNAAGVRSHADAAAGLLSFFAGPEPDPVRIRTLGSFSVLRDGQPVALGQWGSRKARDLLKVLVARRGRAAPREFLMETLWPGEDPDLLGNRLSVALSHLRSVLDPQRQFGAEHYVAGTKTAVTLRLDVLPVDVEEFLADAEAGRRLLRQGDVRQASERLRVAEEAYAGDFLEEDAYEEWAAGLREEARMAYIAVAQALSEMAARDGDLDGAARYLVRLLERDPYDEAAHQALMSALARAGHHGEARRCYTNYAARMAEIGVEASPYQPVDGHAGG